MNYLLKPTKFIESFNKKKICCYIHISGYNLNGVTHYCFEPDTDYSGNDITQRLEDTLQKCFEFCQQTSGCKVFTWHKTGKQCLLKSKRENQNHNTNYISGPSCGENTFIVHL